MRTWIVLLFSPLSLFAFQTTNLQCGQCDDTTGLNTYVINTEARVTRSRLNPCRYELYAYVLATSGPVAISYKDKSTNPIFGDGVENTSFSREHSLTRVRGATDGQSYHVHTGHSAGTFGSGCLM